MFAFNTRHILCGILGFYAAACAGSVDDGADASIDASSGCSALDDFTPCTLVTDPDRSYDICVDGNCVSPGCGDATCNTPSPHFPIPDTSQRFCYDFTGVTTCPTESEDFFGQDAQYGWDAIHDPNARFSRDLSAMDQPVVSDNVTGLFWQGCQNGFSGSECETNEAGSFCMTWDESLAFCDSLQWAGYSDWRLPDQYELWSIVDADKSEPAIDSDAFPGYVGSYVWTSTSYVVTAANVAWSVHFGDGFMGLGGKQNCESARCVRGGPMDERRLEPSIVSGDRVVVDSLTGLIWQGCAAGLSGDNCEENTGEEDEHDWQSALLYCENLTWGGQTDWRLPNADELISIIDSRREEASIDLTAFPSTATGSNGFWCVFWSSTTHEYNPAEAWSVHFGNDQNIHVESREKAEAIDRFVRCVRGGA